MATPLRVKRGTKAQLDSAAGTNGLAAGEPYLITDQGGRLAVGTGSGTYAFAQQRGMSTFCSGKPADAEVIGGSVAPYAFVLVTSRCKAIASTAATASTTFVIKNNGSQIGTVVFGVGETVGTVSISGASVSLGDRITIEAPTTADATLANITILLVE